MDRISNNLASKELTHAMAEKMKELIPDAVIKVYQDKFGDWRWSMDGVEMMSIKFESLGENN